MILAPEHWSAVRHAIASQQAQAIEPIQAQPGASALGQGGPLCIYVKELAQDAGEGADAQAGAHTSVLPRPSSHGWQECPSAADDLCWVFYTSGSSGLPKGVLCQHKCASFCTSVRFPASFCTLACACERACGSAPTWVSGKHVERASADSEAQHACRSAVAYLKHHPLFDAQLTGVEALPGPQSPELPLPSPEETDLLSRGCAKRKRGREGAEVGITGVGAWRVLVASAFTFDPSGHLAGGRAAPLRRGRVEQPAALTTRTTCGRH